MTARIAVRVQPGARRDALLARLDSGVFKLAVAAPPLEGRANEAVEKRMAEWLGVKRRQVSIARGSASRDKWVDIEGLEQHEAEARLARQLPPEREGTERV